MGRRWFTRAFVALMLGLSQGGVQAAEEAQLVGLINHYRSEVQRCGTQASEELPPLSADPRLLLPATGRADLQAAMASSGYPMVNVQAISLSGPRDAASALQVLKESFCQIVLDPQFVDIGVSRQDRDWRILLARPLLEFYGKMAAFDQLKSQTGDAAILVMLVTSGLSHLPPMKVVTILSGLVSFDLKWFILSAIVARGGRFYLLAYLLKRYGVQIAAFVETRLHWIALGVIAVLAVLVVLVEVM